MEAQERQRSKSQPQWDCQQVGTMSVRSIDLARPVHWLQRKRAPLDYLADTAYRSMPSQNARAQRGYRSHQVQGMLGCQEPKMSQARVHSDVRARFALAPIRNTDRRLIMIMLLSAFAAPQIMAGRLITTR
ncbi:hypothetical protein GGI08_000679 [Coemansia sp. S2]|nr:hypothetical protein GGI14_004277 [Coemansia sp. S680]KAJ2041202.1 hypothetical protein H4S03_000538 [Coemansia sp. S3946]KAJ2068808.1 hypothetical protein GGI08_000679 [Coemansia sp. S2]